ncbi:MAG TPA: hypothetical protein VGI03_03175 [Verrucomicrobiae bacterium]
MNAMTILNCVGREQRPAQKICGLNARLCKNEPNSRLLRSLRSLWLFPLSAFRFFRLLRFLCFFLLVAPKPWRRRITHPLRQVTRNYVKLRLTRLAVDAGIGGSLPFLRNFADLCIKAPAFICQTSMKRSLNLTEFTGLSETQEKLECKNYSKKSRLDVPLGGIAPTDQLLPWGGPIMVNLAYSLCLT